MCNRSATSPNIAPTRKSVLFFGSTTFLWLCNVVRISEASQLSFLWYYLVLGWVECTITLYFPLAKRNQRAVHQTLAGRSWIISQRMRSLQSKTAVQGPGHLHQCDRTFLVFAKRTQGFDKYKKSRESWGTLFCTMLLCLVTWLITWFNDTWYMIQRVVQWIIQ